MKTCIECGRIYDEKEARQNPYWCPVCDKKRIDRITKKLHALVEKMEKESEIVERKEE